MTESSTPKMKGKHESPHNRFWRSVTIEKSCWPWHGNRIKQRDGKLSYGLIWTGKISELAHRFSYQLHFGPIPEGMIVMHTCDNDRCVNPGHLVLGTYKENMADMRRKNRDKIEKGEDRYNAKLTTLKVQNIRKSTKKLRVLAEYYSVSESTISNVRHMRAWRHVA